jgi:hypothetical protein
VILIRLPNHVVVGHLIEDFAGQFLLEADARRNGMVIKREYVDGKLRYRFRVDTVGEESVRLVRVDFSSRLANPAIHVDGPRCLRHRWKNDSLCMWDPSGPPTERWVTSDGLPELAKHVRVHVFCEAECRSGKSWPKDEMAGPHPRKQDCPSCHGRGQ